MIDTHAHLSASAFDPDRDAVIARALAAGHVHLVEVGIEPASSQAAIELSRRHRQVWAAVGIHPHASGDHVPADLDPLIPHLESGEAVAVGELGLDFYRDYAPRDRQEAVFRRQIELGLEYAKPLVIHSRGAEERVVEILEEYDAGRVGGVLHCYGGPVELIPRIVALGFHLGFGGAVTRSKGRYRKMLPEVPPDRLLLETDCPYLAPVPGGASRRNEPAFLVEVVPTMASMCGMSQAELIRVTDENACRLFGLPRPE
jgi:TatD DNase family protein